LYVLGSRAAERRNAMTISWATQVSIRPKQIGVGVLNESRTHELISAGGVFALSIMHRDDRALVRKFVKPVPESAPADSKVGAWSGSLNGVAFRTATSGAPVLSQALAYVDCELRHALELGDHTFFVGEVIDARFLADEAAPVLRMEDTRMNYGG